VAAPAGSTEYLNIQNEYLKPEALADTGGIGQGLGCPAEANAADVVSRAS